MYPYFFRLDFLGDGWDIWGVECYELKMKLVFSTMF